MATVPDVKYSVRFDGIERLNAAVDALNKAAEEFDAARNALEIAVERRVD